MPLTKLSVVAALVAASAMATTASASADTTSCTAAGSVKLSPGLSETAARQNVQIKGTLSGCSGEESSEVTGGSFQIHGKTEAAITCAALKSGAATDPGPIKLKWKPTPAAGSQSQGTVSVQLIEGAGFLSGLITSGPFGDNDLIGGERVLTQVYTGGPECGKETEHMGKKKANKVNKGTVSGTLSISF
jgi:hypothetical protein